MIKSIRGIYLNAPLTTSQVSSVALDREIVIRRDAFNVSMLGTDEELTNYVLTFKYDSTNEGGSNNNYRRNIPTLELLGSTLGAALISTSTEGVSVQDAIDSASALGMKHLKDGTGAGSIISYTDESGTTNTLEGAVTYATVLGTSNSISQFSSTSSILGGSLNVIEGDQSACSAIVNGLNNYIYGTLSFGALIGAGSLNNIYGRDAKYTSIISGQSNSIYGYSSQCSIIGAGSENKIHSDVDLTSTSYAFIGAGIFNEIYGGLSDNAFIGAGEGNKIYGDNSVSASIVGGYLNSINSGRYSTIAGGNSNSMRYVNSSSIIGGYLNYIYGDNTSGTGNSGTFFDPDNASISYAIIAGGYYNGIEDDADFSGIFAGDKNRIKGISTKSVILGGAINIIRGNNDLASIVGGVNNLIVGNNNSTTGHGIFSSNSSVIDNSDGSTFGSHVILGGVANYIINNLNYLDGSSSANVLLGNKRANIIDSDNSLITASMGISISNSTNSSIISVLGSTHAIFSSSIASMIASQGTHIWNSISSTILASAGSYMEGYATIKKPILNATNDTLTLGNVTDLVVGDTVVIAHAGITWDGAYDMYNNWVGGSTKLKIHTLVGNNITLNKPDGTLCTGFNTNPYITSLELCKIPSLGNVNSAIIADQGSFISTTNGFANSIMSSGGSFITGDTYDNGTIESQYIVTKFNSIIASGGSYVNNSHQNVILGGEHLYITSRVYDVEKGSYDSALIGGYNNRILGSYRSGILGGTGNTLDGVVNAWALGLTDVTVSRSNAVYVPSLSITNSTLDINATGTVGQVLGATAFNGNVATVGWVNGGINGKIRISYNYDTANIYTLTDAGDITKNIYELYVDDRFGTNEFTYTFVLSSDDLYPIGSVIYITLTTNIATAAYASIQVSGTETYCVTGIGRCSVIAFVKIGVEGKPWEVLKTTGITIT